MDKTVLRAAREMTLDGRIGDETFERLRDFLDDELLVDLTLIVGFYNAVVRVLATLEIDVEPDYAEYLREFPLPRR